MKLPDSHFTVSNVKANVGANRQVEVVVGSTKDTYVMSMYHFCKYYTSKTRPEVLNVSAIEFSGTSLESLVQPPSVVKQLDWVDVAWPRHLKKVSKVNSHKLKYPKVQKYVQVDEFVVVI